MLPFKMNPGPLRNTSQKKLSLEWRKDHPTSDMEEEASLQLRKNITMSVMADPGYGAVVVFVDLGKAVDEYHETYRFQEWVEHQFKPRMAALGLEVSYYVGVNLHAEASSEVHDASAGASINRMKEKLQAIAEKVADAVAGMPDPRVRQH